MNTAFDVLHWTLSVTTDTPLPPPKLNIPGVTVRFLDYGVIAVEPEQGGNKAVVISCAVHGNETAPIEMVRDMLTDIFNGRLAVTQPTLFLIANPWAIKAQQRFVDVNMNRLFSGAHEQGDSIEHQHAGKLEAYIEAFYERCNEQDISERYHYDLHTAIRDSQHEKFAIYPFRHGKPYSRQQLTFLAECGVDTILLSQTPTTTFSYYSSEQHGAHAFTVELGKVRPFGENDMSRFAAADHRFRELISSEQVSLPAFDPARHTIYDVHQVINRTNEDFSLNFPDDVANFTRFQRGELLATDGNEEHRVDAEQEAIVFPNAQVALGQRALLTVVPVIVDDLPLN